MCQKYDKTDMNGNKITQQFIVMYVKLKQLICDLDAMNISPRPFIGYGNPDANILIVGKECAWESNSEDWLKF